MTKHTKLRKLYIKYKGNKRQRKPQGDQHWTIKKHKQGEFEDTKGVIRIRKWKGRQHNGQKKKCKRTAVDLQNIHIKLKIE